MTKSDSNKISESSLSLNMKFLSRKIGDIQRWQDAQEQSITIIDERKTFTILTKKRGDYCSGEGSFPCLFSLEYFALMASQKISAALNDVSSLIIIGALIYSGKPM
jgi:hypothetical protein